MIYMYTKGTAKFTDANAYIAWYEQLSLEDAYNICSTVVKTQKKPNNEITPIYRCAKDMFEVRSWASCPTDQTKEYKWPIQRDAFAEKVRSFIWMADTYKMPIRVGEWHEGLFAFLYLGNPKQGIIVPGPEKHLRYIPEKDYGDITPAQLRAALNVPDGMAGMEMVLAGSDQLTTNTIASEKSVYEEALAKANAKIDRIEKYETPELAAYKKEIERLQQEMYAKKTQLMNELKEKMAEMEAMKESLENQIFFIDSQIYNIRCFAGEVVQFGTVRSGKKAPDTSPVVIYQKLHYLDEDLGRLASIYEIQWHQLSKFEDFLRYSPAALDTFAPNERCISLVRLSKTATTIGENERIPFQNMLRNHEYYHGGTIGIIIRNGENLYLGWTDEERIRIKDDLILSKIITETEPAPPSFHFESDREAWEKKQKAQRKEIVHGLISRSFVYNILQGVVEHTSLLPLPAGVSLNKQCEYVIYSVADMWITDNRFGSFTDIIERCNEQITKGDPVLTVQHLIPERDYHPYVGWHHRENVRGRGYNCRTHDVAADDCTIYPVNLIECEEPERKIRYRYKSGVLPDESDKWVTYVTDASRRDSLSEGTEIIEEFEYIKKHIYISLEKEYSDCGARSNFEIMPSEFINLQYMNSVWLEYVICNKSLGDWRIGGTEVNYAYAIQYLKTALDFVRKREENEKINLYAAEPGIISIPEWQVALSEWKLAKGVRELTPYQAKRFAKYMKRG